MRVRHAAHTHTRARARGTTQLSHSRLLSTQPGVESLVASKKPPAPTAPLHAAGDGAAQRSGWWKALGQGQLFCWARGSPPRLPKAAAASQGAADVFEAARVPQPAAGKALLRRNGGCANCEGAG